MAEIRYTNLEKLKDLELSDDQIKRIESAFESVAKQYEIVEAVDQIGFQMWLGFYISITACIFAFFNLYDGDTKYGLMTMCLSFCILPGSIWLLRKRAYEKIEEINARMRKSGWYLSYMPPSSENMTQLALHRLYLNRISVTEK